MAALVGALRASCAVAQSYGNENQVLTIGAAEFRAYSADEGFIDASGYVFATIPGGSVFYAPLALPEGALIEEICLYAYTTVGLDISGASIAAVKLVPGGEDPDVHSQLTLPFSASNGYGLYCSDPFAYTLRSAIDVDGDGTLDNAVFYARVGLSRSLALGGMRITWKRAVSSPPETPDFSDVPASDPAFAYVEALKASGITAGCSETSYCPDAILTRRQMSVFLAKALGLHWTDSAP
jgi:hypothetical protein